MMTPDELLKAIQKSAQTEETMRRRIVEAARAVVPVLKDAGRIHSAKQLDELFSEYDAMVEEATKLARENWPDLFTLLKREASER